MEYTCVVRDVEVGNLMCKTGQMLLLGEVLNGPTLMLTMWLCQCGRRSLAGCVQLHPVMALEVRAR